MPTSDTWPFVLDYLQALANLINVWVLIITFKSYNLENLHMGSTNLEGFCYDSHRMLFRLSVPRRLATCSFLSAISRETLLTTQSMQEMVKLLSTKAKLEKVDRLKRSALTHATMNGAANVVSFLLAKGSNPNRVDSSGKELDLLTSFNTAKRNFNKMRG